MAVDALPLTAALTNRLLGQPLVLLLDIDGTLAPIAPRPQDAAVPPETLAIVRDFAATPGVYVVVVSGRAVDDARRIVPADRAWVIGNHGVELGEPGRPAAPRADIAPYAQAIALAAERVLAAFSNCDGVIIENKRWTISVHYRLASRAIVPRVIEQTAAVARELDLLLTDGKEVLEIRPPIQVNKGTASIELVERFHAFEKSGSVLCAGDDRTDEDMFRSVRSRDPRAVTVRVAPHRETIAAIDAPDALDTFAEFRVDDPDAVRELLAAVFAIRAAPP
ncbi:MAG TPA: trehalose-phosphatase [Casimicrobiaceae bacterium]|jgi:trehalose 6-phosphate phosphatase